MIDNYEVVYNMHGSLPECCYLFRLVVQNDHQRTLWAGSSDERRGISQIYQGLTLQLMNSAAV